MIVWEGVADPGDGFDGHGLFCSGRREAHTCDCGAPGWPVPGMSHAALADPEYGTGWDEPYSLPNFSDPVRAALLTAEIEGFIAGLTFRIAEITRVPAALAHPSAPDPETFEYTFRLVEHSTASVHPRYPHSVIYMDGDDK